MYYKTLQKIIAKTNLTQDELSEKCKELNAPISRGRINEILNQKAPPPNEDVSRAIAKICNVDDRELVIEGYLEKAPKEFIEFINKFQELTFQLSFAQLQNKFPKEIMDIYIEEYKKQTYAKSILEILDIKDTVTIDNDIFKITDLKNEFSINFNIPYLTMEDDSMESKIPKDSKLKLIIPDKYKNGDIVLVEYNNNKYIRLVIFFGRDIFLYALNEKYESFYLKNGEYKIICKIDSIEYKI